MDKVSLGCFEALINCLLWRVLLWKQRTYRPRRSCLKKCYVHPFFVMFADFLVRLRSMWVVQCCWQAWCPAFVQIEIIHTLPWRNWAEILWSCGKRRTVIIIILWHFVDLKFQEDEAIISSSLLFSHIVKIPKLDFHLLHHVCTTFLSDIHRILT